MYGKTLALYMYNLCIGEEQSFRSERLDTNFFYYFTHVIFLYLILNNII